MKNLKKLIVMVVAIATLGTVSTIPMNAEVENTSISTSISEEDITNAIDVAIIKLDGRTFVVNARFEIIGNMLIFEPDEEEFESGLMCDDLNAITNIIDAELSKDGTYSIVLDREYCYQRFTYSAETGEWTSSNEVVQKPLANDEYLSPDGIRYRVEKVDGETYVYDLNAMPIDCQDLSDDDIEITKYIVNTDENVMYYMDEYHYIFNGWDENGLPIIEYDDSFYDDREITILKNNGSRKYQAYNISSEFTPLVDDTMEYNKFADRNNSLSAYNRDTIYFTKSQEDIQTISEETQLATNPYNGEKYEIPPYYNVIGWFSSGQPILGNTFVADYSDDVITTNDDGITIINKNKYEVIEKTVDDNGITHISYTDENYPNEVKTSSYGVKTYTDANGETITSDKYGIFTDSNGEKYIIDGNNKPSVDVIMIYDKNGELVEVIGAIGEDASVSGEDGIKGDADITISDSLEYIKNIFDTNVNEYLKTTGVDQKIKCTPILEKEDNLTSKYNFLYYSNIDKYYSLASFGASIGTTIYFESSNENLTINDILTTEQLNEIENLKGSIPQGLTNKGIDESTGLTTYSLYLHLPYDNGIMSYNDTVAYRYNLAKSLVDNGVIDNAYLSGDMSYDDYNNIMIQNGDCIVVMNDNIELTKDMFGEYADVIQSFEKVTCEDGTTINGNSEYYTFTKSEDTEISDYEIFLGLQNNDNIKFAGYLNPSYMRTELWQEGKDSHFKIPILSDNPIVDDDNINKGDSKVTALQGDANLDGDVNGLDLLYLKKYLLGLINF